MELFSTGDEEGTIVLMHAAITGESDIVNIVLNKIKELEKYDEQRIKVIKTNYALLSVLEDGLHSLRPSAFQIVKCNQVLPSAMFLG